MQTFPSWLDVHPEVAAALVGGRPVVALESSLIAQGLPWPDNWQTARRAEEAIREHNAVPATIAVWRGRPTIGLNEEVLKELAQAPDQVLKLSRRDLAGAMVQKRTGATTVAATMFLAHSAGIRVFATGGIGGVHRRSPGAELWDVSADLLELARTPVAVVCAGAKSILDIPQTLEMLETLGVPVLGFGTSDFPGFYVRSTGQPVSVRVDTVDQASELLSIHWQMDGAGVVLAQPLPTDTALQPQELEEALEKAERRAIEANIHGARVTPFLLRQLAELTGGRTLAVNKALIVANARLAAQLAMELAR